MRIRITVCLLYLVMILTSVVALGSEDYTRGKELTADRVLAAGRVRAQVIEDELQLIGGPKAQGRKGDFLIYNDRVGFVIAGARAASGLNPFGGVVEDAGILKNDGEKNYWWNLMGDSGFALYKGTDPLTASRLFAPVKAEVLKDGTGGEAVVRVYGRDAEFQIRKEFLSIASQPMKLKLTVDYILKPDTNVLEIKVTAINEKKGDAVIGIGQTYLMGDGAFPFYQGCGYNMGCVEEKSGEVFMAAGSGVAYGWFLPEGDIEMFARFDQLLVARSGAIKAPGGGDGSITVYLAVGSDPASVLESVYRFKGRSDVGVVSGRCMSENGTPAVDAVVHVLSPEGEYLNRSEVAEDGTFRLVMPEGGYVLQAASYERDDPAPSPVEIRKGVETAVSLVLRDTATLEYEVRDNSGNLIPAAVSLKAVAPAAGVMNDPRYHINKNGWFYKNTFTGNGAGAVSVKPGKYEVYFSRGMEYEYVKEELELKAGENGKIEVALERVVDTAGYLSGDFHIHAAPSYDSSDRLIDKVLALAGTGLEVPVATDHDVRTDYSPIIEELGLGREMKSIVGEELTTKRLGHFNAYPLSYDTMKPNNGATVWFGLTGGEIMKAQADDPAGKKVVQINHARDINLGYLGLINYNPATGKASDEKNFSLDFNAMEILNGVGYSRVAPLLADWFSFLNRGRQVTGVGNSDSHQAFDLSVGYPRNFVKSPTDVPGEMVTGEFIDSVLGQKVTVSGGAFVTVSVNGAGPGETAGLTGGKAVVDITVQAPSWVEVDSLTIYQGGEVVKRSEIQGSETPVRHKGSFEFLPTADTWYVVAVEGAKDLFPVFPGARAYSFTNPVYLDADGNGKYDAPLSF